MLQRGISDESTFELCLKVMEILIRKRERLERHMHRKTQRGEELATFRSRKAAMELQR